MAITPRHWRLSIVLALLVVLAGATLTWLAWRDALSNERRATERALVARSTNIEITLRARLLAYEAVLRAGVGLFEASREVSAEEWRAFAEQLQLATFYPGLQGLGFAVRIGRAETITDRDRTAIIYLEPRNERNTRALGFDMMSEGVRRAAMERARDEGRSALSGKVTLVQEITEDKQAGFLMYVPVYEGLRGPANVRKRREALKGFVYCPFRAADFLNTVLDTLIEDVHLEVYDLSESGQSNLIFSSASNAPPSSPAVVNSRVVDVLGNRWMMRMTALAPFVDARISSDRNWVVMTGVASTLLLAGLVSSLALSRQRLAEKLAAESSLRERERYSAGVLENSLEAYIAVDSQDRIVEWNRQAEIVFGWDRRSALGLRLVETIIPPRYRDQHLQAVLQFQTRTHTLLGRRVEMPALRHDGQEITVELSIIPTTRGDQPLYVASIRDITELRRREAEIAALNATLEQRVGQRTEELAEANRELHAANEQLEAFAQNVSHDLRAPLRAVEGYTQIAIDESAGQLPSSARTHLATAVRQVHKMHKLIDDLLKLAFIGRQHVQKRVVNLWTLIRGVISDLQARNIPTIDMKPEALGDVFVDPSLLEHALRNLLSNAVKFSQHVSEPRIEIGSKIIDGERVFFVKDNGVGFENKYAAQLFRVFHRLHGPEQFEGTGVGLSIVKSVIEKHGGRVWAEAHPGKGATFFFTLAER